MKKRFVQLRLPARVARRINWRVRPDNWQLLVRSAWLVAVAIGLMSFQASGADWPEHLTLHEESRSPDGHYGIVVTTSSHVDDGDDGVELRRARNSSITLPICKRTGCLEKSKALNMSSTRIMPIWMRSGRLIRSCVWRPTWERYGFASAVVLQPKGDSFIQTDIGQRIRKAIDAMIKKQSRDVDADVYPQFYIEPGPKIRVYAEASNNPKQLEDTKTYYALFQGVFDPISKKWTASSARAITAKEDELLQSASEASCCFEVYAVSPDPFKEYPDAEEPFAYRREIVFSIR